MNVRTKTTLSILLPLLLLGILILVYFIRGASGNHKFTSTDYTITAKALNLEFLKNDSLSLKKYGNKTIEISGVVAATKKSPAHGLIVTLDDPMMGIKCVMDPTYKEVTPEMQPGQVIKIKGICVGSDHIIGVMMNQCIVVDK